MCDFHNTKMEKRMLILILKFKISFKFHLKNDNKQFCAAQASQWIWGIPFMFCVVLGQITRCSNLFKISHFYLHQFVHFKIKRRIDRFRKWKSDAILVATNKRIPMIVVNSSRSRTRLSHFSRGIWEIHAEYTCFLRLQLLAKIGYIPQCKGKNPRGLYEISFPNGLIQILIRLVGLANGKPHRCYYTCDHMTFMKWAASRQNQQNDCAPSEDSDESGIRPVWSVFAVRSMSS